MDHHSNKVIDQDDLKKQVVAHSLDSLDVKFKALKKEIGSDME